MTKASIGINRSNMKINVCVPHIDCVYLSVRVCCIIQMHYIDPNSICFDIDFSFELKGGQMDIFRVLFCFVTFSCVPVHVLILTFSFSNFSYELLSKSWNKTICENMRKSSQNDTHTHKSFDYFIIFIIHLMSASPNCR